MADNTSTPPPTSVQSLNTLVDRTSDLLVSLYENAHAPEKLPPLLGPDGKLAEVDPFKLAVDVATTLKAHSTKIGLLVTHEPFTPTAISTELRAMSARPFPALLTLMQACQKSRYSAIVTRQLGAHCRFILLQLREMALTIPRDGKALSKEKREGGKGMGMGSMAVTGTLWSACDKLADWGKRGMAGNISYHIRDTRDVFLDTIAELKEWSEETEEEPAGGSGPTDLDNGADGQPEDDHMAATQRAVDEIMDGVDPIPRDDPDNIRGRLDVFVKRLRLTAHLATAITKRRVETLPPPAAGSTSLPADIVTRVDEIIEEFKLLNNSLTEVVGAFYEQTPGDIDEQVDRFFFTAFRLSELALNNWQGQRDDFSAWVLKYQAEIKGA